MILQALTKLYYDLCEKTVMPKEGFSAVSVSAIVMIDINGALVDVVPSYQEENNLPEMMVPLHLKRSGSKPKPYYLCDSFSYIFGIEPEGKKYPGKTEKEQEAARIKAVQDAEDKYNEFCRIHKSLLSKIEVAEAQALLSFLNNWDVRGKAEIDVANVVWSFSSKGNIVFRCVDTGRYLHEIPEIQDAISAELSKEEAPLYGTCLVTGKEEEIARIHNSVKGIVSPVSSPNGWTLVSFDKAAFSSYGKSQGANAPIGKKAAFAYTTALNYLLSDRENVQHIGDTTVVCWSNGAQSQYSTLSLAAIFGASPPADMDENDLRAIVKRLAEGKPCEERDLYPETVFYILGIAPNAARLSVRFFYKSTFGELMRNVNRHHERMRIVGNKYEYMPLWAMLKETTNQNSKDKLASPVLSGATARAIFTDSLYPAGLLEAVMLRIRAERKITPGRAAIIKAYYLKNNNNYPKEVLTVSLNENSTNVPYTIGRLFAVYEAAQQKVNPGINTTIRDKYFNSVAATPSRILPVLNNLYQKHLRKMDKGSQVYFEKQVGELLGILGENLPDRLSLPEQGAFQLGYYHQNQKRFEKKER